MHRKASDIQSYNDLMLAYQELLNLGYDSLIHKNTDAEVKFAVEAMALKAGLSLSAIIQLGTVYNELNVSYQMLSRYPWHGTRISKIEHLELTWFLFQNLCYKFKEKVKLCFNSQKLACASLKLEQPNWIKDELRIIERKFSKEIQDRGNSVHSWTVRDPSLEVLATASFLDEIRLMGVEFEIPTGLEDVDKHYRRSKEFLKWRASSSIKVAESTLINILEKKSVKPIDVVLRLKQLISAANNGEFRK
ncbi:hypothetical protein DSM107133_00536 [Pseudosulfitobacter sp. DSM 107133]|nr:hypothetical protein DSM107133_00536 [Pseudosulfitobacter sp. DSM 107133]